MNSLRETFFVNVAQTSEFPFALEMEKAEGVFIYDSKGKKYIDLISGISVSNLGHNNPQIISAIKNQLDKHLHLMVYGEYIQTPQVKFAESLSKFLPNHLKSVYFTNSGAEAIEGAMKLAKRFTGRTEIISFMNAYHGSTNGALSIMGNEEYKNSFRPLLPDVKLLDFNSEKQFSEITTKSACVIIEPIQGEAGIILPENNFLQLLRKKCDETGALLVFDEVQTGMGRTGKLFAFEHYKVPPDILCLAKAFGGGMPLGAFISSKEIMDSLTNNPSLGHITTFGGHPVCCAAGMASFAILSTSDILKTIPEKEFLFRKLLVHNKIKQVRGKGLLIAVQFENEQLNKKIISRCIENGVIVDWFLFNTSSMRIAPPLIISEKEIKKSCEIILKSMAEITEH